MLKTRVLTALALLSVLLPVLFSGSFMVFALVALTFFSAAIWENFRLFKSKQPIGGALLWTVAFGFMVYGFWFSRQDGVKVTLLFGICTAIWMIRLTPSLAFGLPSQRSVAGRLLSYIYSTAIFGCFAAMIVLFRHSPLYFLSVMAIVWIADIGAYFSGKAFGKRKLAPSISPGKSWEGAIGGWISVLLVAAASTGIANLKDTFAVHLLTGWGWGGFIAVLTLLAATSVVGDLFESLLKRRAGIKDSSNLLPGHGGVLDRIDALIPVLPLAALISLVLWRNS